MGTSNNLHKPIYIHRLANMLKTSSILTFSLFAFLFFSSFENGIAQSNCPTGWTQTSTTFNYVPPSGTISCRMTIEICFRCGLSSPYGFEYRIDVYTPESSDCYYTMKENFNDLKNKAVDHVMSIAATLCTVPPCGNQLYSVVTVSTPLCMNFYNVPNSDVIRAEPCYNTPYCVQEFYACLSYNYTPPRLYYQSRISITTTGTPNCYLTSKQVAVPIIDGTNSECFIVECK